jgi:hypothetical protein
MRSMNLLGFFYPAHEEYWGEVKDYNQRLVEMAAYGVSLALVPEKIWCS